MEFRVLGPLEVVHKGRPVAVAGREGALLALLLLSPNQTVPSERLAEELWPGGSPNAAAQSVRATVSRLRKALRAAGGDDVVATRPAGYVVHVDPDALDAARFEALRAEASSQAAHGDCATAARILRSALALWRGPPLAELLDSPVGRGAATRLEEARLAAIEACVDAELACGRHAEIVGELEAITRSHPMSERFWAQRMVALYRSGRQAEAVRAYQELRRFLGEELGIEPSEDLRRLERAILRQESALDWRPPPPGKATARPTAAPIGKRNEPARLIPSSETDHQAEPLRARLARMPFVGREAELRRLKDHLNEAAAGRGGMVVLAGEPGIGKTRLTEELAEHATEGEWLVAWGRCFEGDYAPPYLPFAEAIEAIATSIPVEGLGAELSPVAGPLVQLVPRLRHRLPDAPDPVRLQPDEERFRILDAVGQFVTVASRRMPLLVCLDDLHWADGGTAAMLRHVARFLPPNRVLLVATYRDTEIARRHPLAEALTALHRESNFKRIKLGGLEPDDVGELLGLLTENFPHVVVDSITKSTEGNPFFIKEVVHHLLEEGKISLDADGRWTSALSISQLGIPDGIRDTIHRRLSRLSGSANRLLGVACAFEGEFNFEVVAEVAELEESAALDALDEAVAAELVQPLGGSTSNRFSHALIRQTLYEDLSPARRVRIHRRMAEALSARHSGHLSPAQAAEIASQYHRSADLPGATTGVEPALMAASHAEATGGHYDAARFLRIALDLLADGDARLPRLLARLGIVLAWALDFDEAARVIAEAGEAIAEVEGPEAAAEYLSEATYACRVAGGQSQAWALALQGLRYAGNRRDAAWARLVYFDLERRAAEDPDHPGIPVDVPECHEAARILRDSHLDPLGPAPMEAPFASRDEAMTSENLIVQMLWAGEYARALPRFEREAELALARGQLGRAIRAWGGASCCYASLGHSSEARRSLNKTQRLAERWGQPVFTVLAAESTLAIALDEGLEELAAHVEELIRCTGPDMRWTLGATSAVAARTAARLGRAKEAFEFLELVVPWLERAPNWTLGFPSIACYAAETLWVFSRRDHLAVIEHALRHKILPPDFRNPNVDARLALARLCALNGRYQEAQSWLAQARAVLTEQGARPLLAISDFDEALMYLRRGHPNDAGFAIPLLEAAHAQFEALGMTGWLRKADDLVRDLR